MVAHVAMTKPKAQPVSSFSLYSTRSGTTTGAYPAAALPVVLALDGYRRPLPTVCGEGPLLPF